MRRKLLATALGLLLPLAAGPAAAADQAVLGAITEWKAVFGKVEARNTVPARARIGGTLTEIAVTEGDDVAEGQKIATVNDPKIALMLASLAAKISALQSQLDNAQTELTRGENLRARGVATVQQLDNLQTQVDVLKNEIEAARAERRVVAEQNAEGAVLAPIAGRVTHVPVTAGSVLMPGEPVATIAGDGFFVRVAVPERHARSLRKGAEIRIGDEPDGMMTGQLAKIYPQIEDGRVIADIEVAGLETAFLDARVLVRLPVDETRAVLVPADLLVTRSGLDFVAVETDGHAALRAVVPGRHHQIDGREMVEILSGVEAGETIVAPRDVAYTPAKGASHD